METTVEAFAAAADKKRSLLGRSRTQFFIASALAGAYIGFGIALIFAIGAPLSAAHSPFLRVVMGASFGVALTLVIFAGAELFTGNTMVLTLGVLTGRVRWATLASVWGWSYGGNLAGSVFLAWLIAQSGALGDDPQQSFIEGVAVGKMQLTFGAAFARGILANWLVCLAVWMATRTTSDVAKLIVIFWCLFAFIGAGFEHSIANMTLLSWRCSSRTATPSRGPGSFRTWCRSRSATSWAAQSLSAGCTGSPRLLAHGGGVTWRWSRTTRLPVPPMTITTPPRHESLTLS